MTAQGWLQIGIYLVLLTALTPVIGAYMARVFRGERVPVLSAVVAPVERLTYRLIRANPSVEQDWKSYARTALVFSAFSWATLYLILRMQGSTPLNPEGFGAAPWDVTFNTASSFVANTNWQFYGGETTMSYFSQMAGLAVQNFLSAAVGIAVCLAVIRGFVARSGRSLGNFWQDLVRTLLYVLVPLSFSIALFFVSQGVIQNLSRLCHLRHAGGRRADARARTGRLAGGDQAARDQRRRLLQRQPRDAVREPERSGELRPDARDPDRSPRA